MRANCKNLSFSQAKALMEQHPECLILDVREEEEYDTGHAENAILFPLSTIDRETAARVIPKKDTMCLLYCKSGRRSQTAAQILLGYGYTNLYDMGGLVGWPYGLSYSD